jgi:diacylglycerol kinase (ATP)
MRISLLYNEDAGDGTSKRDLRKQLEREGHTLVRVLGKKSEFERVFEDSPELVVAAGGDGTVSAAARVLAGHRVPLAILPIGTANNIAKSLGIDEPMAELIRRWDSARRRPLDLGIVSASWGHAYFLEGVGGGLIPAGITAMTDQPPDEDDSSTARVAHAVRGYRDVLSRLKPRHWTLTVDGTPMSGDFLLLEVLNIRSVGPNLVLAPDADPTDGFFSLVTASEQNREQLDDYLQHQIDGRDCQLSLPSQPARQIEIQAPDAVHIDDKVPESRSTGILSIRIEPAALEFLA